MDNKNCHYGQDYWIKPVFPGILDSLKKLKIGTKKYKKY